MPVLRHVSRCLVAGVVATLPVAGTVFTVWYLEATIAGPWLVSQPFYFTGLGILVALLAIYAIGLTVTTFLGRWLWGACDRVLDTVPMLGPLYQSLKQVLGYGEGKGAMFERVVLIPGVGGQELALVTGQSRDGKAVVFVPGSPMPTTGRLVLADPAALTATGMSVSDALKTLVSMGKHEM